MAVVTRWAALQRPGTRRPGTTLRWRPPPPARPAPGEDGWMATGRLPQVYRASFATYRGLVVDAAMWRCA
jgi:hypothetical protein